MARMKVAPPLCTSDHVEFGSYKYYYTYKQCMILPRSRFSGSTDPQMSVVRFLSHFGGTLCPKIERCHLCFSGPPGRTNGFGGWPQNESRGQLLGLWSLEKRRWHSWRESQMVRCVVLICFNHHAIYVRCKITKITQQKTVLGQMPWQCTDWSCSWDTSFCLGGIYKRLKKR